MEKTDHTDPIDSAKKEQEMLSYTNPNGQAIEI